MDLAEIGEDLLLFKETGNYLSDGEQEITLNQVISIIDEYLKNSSTAKIELVFAPSTDVGSAQNLKFQAKTSKSYVSPYNWSHWGHSHK